MAIQQPQFISKKHADQLYNDYVKPLEKKHQGQYAVLTSKHQLIFAPTLVEVIQQTIKVSPTGNFIFKVGDKVLGKLR